MSMKGVELRGRPMYLDMQVLRVARILSHL